MDKQQLIKALNGTINNNEQVRKQSEQQLKLYEQQAGFTNYLLDVINDDGLLPGAIFFKNRINNYWVVPENNKQSVDLFIKDSEKELIKENLISTLIKVYKNTPLKIQLSISLNNILSFEKWNEMVPLIKNLLKQDEDHVYVGLICLFEYCKNYRYDGESTNPVFEEVTVEIFPILEELTKNLINHDRDDMLYLIIKTFKFVTFFYVPAYFQNKLGSWCQLHIEIINKLSNRESKTIKWCFGNLNRLLTKNGGFQTKKSQFVEMFLSFIPEILKSYWEFIEKWSSDKSWLNENALFHLISFIEQVVETPYWSLIEEKLNAIINHVIFPTLQATQDTIELYEDDPNEYFRRFFDINREQNTSDVASINFIYRLGEKQPQSINLIIEIVNEKFNANDLKEIEACFRILSTLSFKLEQSNLPIDQMLFNYVYPKLKSEPWLIARACDTIAMFNHNYSDINILQQIFQRITECFQSDSIPIQLTAADALATLINEDVICEQIQDQSPQIMNNLLEKSKHFESEILTNIMDKFVEKFAKNLQPYAIELATKLIENFLNIANDLLDSHNEEKEYQAAGILNTLVTLIISMSNVPQVVLQLENVLENLIKFIIDNAMIQFITECIEILENLIITDVSPTVWNLYDYILDSFDIYAYEYFDQFQPFFEVIINKGFKNLTIDNNHVQKLISINFNVLKSDNVDPVFAHLAFENIELILLSIKSDQLLAPLLGEIFEIFKSFETEDLFDGYMLHYLSILRIFFASFYINSNLTIEFLKSQNFIQEFFKLWIKYSNDFQSVYGCKLQILASMSILSSNLELQDLIHELVDILLNNLSTLPIAIKKRAQILQNELTYEVEYDDDAELEALKETPIDTLNVIDYIVSNLQSMEQTKYQSLFNDLDDYKKELITDLINK
ncbi:unnamed protein product [Candida verbasci]|uniref:Importin N-terminal domain-containing protein n=1 Tax=Candida verbasci TaxID=1227364 RepID=A0A9W4X8L8_9ASCO|nr:unnamed protein product [Candida verbasci]